MKNKKDLIIMAAAIGLSLLLALILIGLTSEKPVQAMLELVTSPLQNKRKIGLVITTATPVIFTGLAFCIMFKAGQYNMSPDGLLYFGASVAAYFGIELIMPTGLHPIIGMLLTGLLCAVVCTIPGLLKQKWGANIIVSSLMMNYILLYAGLYVLRNITRDIDSGNMASKRIAETVKLPEIIDGTGIHLGVLIAVLAIVLCWLFLYKTKLGYELRLSGSNMSYAKYAGISVSTSIIVAQLIGGFLSGVGGAVELYGNYNRFEWITNPGYGWDGFIAATLAKNNPLYLPLAALFLSYLSVGSNIIVRTCGVPPDVIPTIRGIMIILVAAQNFMASWKQRQTFKEKMAEQKGT